MTSIFKSHQTVKREAHGLALSAVCPRSWKGGSSLKVKPNLHYARQHFYPKWKSCCFCNYCLAYFWPKVKSAFAETRLEGKQQHFSSQKLWTENIFEFEENVHKYVKTQLQANSWNNSCTTAQVTFAALTSHCDLTLFFYSSMYWNCNIWSAIEVLRQAFRGLGILRQICSRNTSLRAILFLSTLKMPYILPKPVLQAFYLPPAFSFNCYSSHNWEVISQQSLYHTVPFLLACGTN